MYLFVCLGWLVSGNMTLLLQLPALVGFCYHLKRLYSHKGFCKWQFVINWGGLKRDQLQDSLLLIFTLSTSTLLPTLVKSQPSAWVICVSVASLPDNMSWLNTNHRLEPFVLVFALFLLSRITHWFQEHKHFSMVRANLSFMLVYTLFSPRSQLHFSPWSTSSHANKCPKPEQRPFVSTLVCLTHASVHCS